MTINTQYGTGTPTASTTGSPENGIPALTVDLEAYSVDWHRSVIHTRPQHGCVLCLPTPCWCGFNDGICPVADEHRREYASSETVWRKAANTPAVWRS
ncbi:hypothetical protein [Paractinoplanes toevensis]|uniref:Uncharacterized protein n=1 Tax=Paractinoplanes toevensis TaxID=571911 RepID=A0A919T9I7_9ACTN|nr:hypothetical protein [Actinoplanes toevensis]GIM90355.1 hypothetical protein Ato02nite_021480 [Actinoplanes toevensis]